jgi:predicted permease
MVRLLRKIQWWLQRRRREDDLREELAFHLAEEADDGQAGGLPEHEARWAAHRNLGNSTLLREELRAYWSWAVLEQLAQDVRYGLRLAWRQPGFTTAAIAVLALAICANTLIFSIADALLFKPLPIERPNEVVFVQPTRSGGFSFPDYRDLRDRNETFSGLAGYRISPMHLEDATGAERVWGYLATGNYFDLLGVRPAIGRLFDARDERRPGDSPIAVLSYDTWRTRFAESPAVVGRTLSINRLPFTIIGVAPAGFYGTERFYRPELWVPMNMQPQIEVGNPWLERRYTRNTWVLGRLKPNVTRQQAQGNLTAVIAVLAREYPRVNADLGVILTQPGLMGDAIGGPARAFLLGLLGLAGLVLLTGCANVASLLLARGADRQRELALRTSLGASAGRLARQVFTETLLLSFLGAVVGAALAWLCAQLLTGWRAPLDFPVQFDIRTDGRVFAFTAALASAAGLIASVAPARSAARLAPNAILRNPIGSWGRRRTWTVRDLLVSGQVALCLALLVATGQAFVGLRRSVMAPLGFNPDRAAVIGFELALAGYDASRGSQFQRRVLDAVTSLPGIEHAAYANSIPLSPDQSSNIAFAESAILLSQGHGHSYYQVSEGYLRAMGTRLVAGREFDRGDNEQGLPVAIVNQAFARRVFGTVDVVGRRYRNALKGDTIEIVGIVEDGKYTSLTEDSRPVALRPILQSYNSTTTLIARSALPTDQVVTALRGVVAKLDPGLPVYGTGGLRQVLALPLLPGRVAAVALSAFGLLALALALTGLHGLVAYTVASRQRDIGIRIALGAARARIVQLTMQRVIVMVGVGLLAGMVLSLAVGRLLSNLVYGIPATEPLTLGGAMLAMLITASVACLGPLIKAIRVDPMVALRHE